MNQTPEELGRKIREARERQGGNPGPDDPKAASPRQDPTSTGRALRASTDLVAGVAVGGFLGYWIDRGLDTKPLFMIVMLFLGFAAGFLNIYRAEMGQDFKIGFRPDKTDTDKMGKDGKETK